MPRNTPATTRSFAAGASMPIDLLRINPKTYEGFSGLDANGNQMTYPTYQAAVQAGVQSITPNYKESISNQAQNPGIPPTPKPTNTAATNPSEVDKYIQGKIDESKKAMNPVQPTQLQSGVLPSNNTVNNVSKQQ